ncbi:hypothetical protein ACFYY3_00985 [Streptomyces sp. NPDC001812]|uniref:hypothetical protein n=1 Tax=Streptomyces sp. NPDC001812 TaxID=3364611 RepID=UPI00367D3642
MFGRSEKPSDDGGFVTTEKAEGGVDTVFVSTEGVRVVHIPGGLTEDELLD